MKVAVLGAAGRMGQRLVHAVVETDGLELSAGVVRLDGPNLNKDVGTLAGLGEMGLITTPHLDEAMDVSDVLIDFSFPEVTLETARVCAAKGKAMIIGTTGMTPEEREELKTITKDIPVVFAPNMSVGVNLCFKLLKDMAGALGDGFDVEIVELHHNKKKDSPSGTAVRMGEVVADALDRDYNQVANYHREGMCGERTAEEIGMQTVRGGDIVGEHTVYFIGMGERIELTHRAMSRDMFARGAARAALWLKGKPAGFYDMQAVLGLE